MRLPCDRLTTARDDRQVRRLLSLKSSPALIGVNFFSEFVNNSLVDSDGIDLADRSTPHPNYAACGGYSGPWVRWAVVRRNALSGVSLASINATLPGDRPACSNVSLVNGAAATPTTDVVAEHQSYRCPSRYEPGGTNVGACAHCVVR